MRASMTMSDPEITQCSRLAALSVIVIAPTSLYALLLSEPWTNWNILAITSGLMIQVCAFRRFHRLQEFFADLIRYCDYWVARACRHLLP